MKALPASTDAHGSSRSGFFSRRVARLQRLFATCACGLFVAGCVVTRTDTIDNGSKDLITASDQPDSSKRAHARMDLAAAYYGRDQMTVALDQIKQAIAADPAYAEAFNLRGLIYAKLDEPALAEESFKRALQLKPKDADTMHNYGWYLCEQKRYAESDAFFNQALAVPQYRDSARTLLTQGVCDSLAGRLAEADSALSRAYELAPANAAVAYNLAQVLYRRAEYERARFYIRRVNALRDVSNAQTLWLAARVEMKLGNRQGAIDFGNQLKNRFPDSREAGSYAREQFDE